MAGTAAEQRLTIYLIPGVAFNVVFVVSHQRGLPLCTTLGTGVSVHVGIFLSVARSHVLGLATSVVAACR